MVLCFGVLICGRKQLMLTKHTEDIGMCEGVCLNIEMGMDSKCLSIQSLRGERYFP